MVAAEARTYSSQGLQIADNSASLAPGGDPAFVADLSGQTLRVTNNRLGLGMRAFERRR